MLKKVWPYALFALTAFTGCQNAPQTEEKNASNKLPSSQIEKSDGETLKISEALGHFIGKNLNSPGIHFDLDSIIKGMRNGASGLPAPMSEQEYEKAMTALQEKAFNALADTNLAAAEEFLKENISADGVIEIVPGKLQYLILEEGTGPAVPEHGSPQINYTGKYLNGTIFGSSENAGGPITIPIDQTISGFSKGIAGMQEREKRRLFVHPEFGYGRSGQLPPNSLLIFDIEVIKATPSQEASNNEISLNDLNERDLDDESDFNQADQESYYQSAY